MAASSQAAKEPKNGPETAPKLDGYDDVTRPDIDGWVKPDVGTVIHGRIVGFFAFEQIVKDKESPSGFKKRTREALCLKVYGNNTRAFKKGDKEGFLLKEGQVIAMSMMHCLEPTREYITMRGQVYVKFTRKEDIGGGQTVWKADVKCKGEKSAPARALLIADPGGTPATEASGDDDSEAPF